MREVSYNKIGSLILFWLELHRESLNEKFDTNELKYVYSLEHIMPQKWEQYWKLDVCPAISVITQDVINDMEKAKEVRISAIYELGNMTLLKSNLNSELRNYEFARKIVGEKRKKESRIMQVCILREK